MILIVNVCLDRLSESEFVRPVEDIIRKNNMSFCTKHYYEVNDEDVNKVERVIICGTALKDLNYLDQIVKFHWLRKIEKPLLGICAGMQIICKLFGCELEEKVMIGRLQVSIVKRNKLSQENQFFSYFLNSKAVKINEVFETFGISGDVACIVKSKSAEVYGCLFHPEVLNQDIIMEFCKID